MKFVFTKHVLDKLKEKEPNKLGITKSKLKAVVSKPKEIQVAGLVKRAVGFLDKEHSLCVIYKIEKGMVKVITFYPAEEGRYEN